MLFGEGQRVNRVEELLEEVNRLKEENEKLKIEIKSLNESKLDYRLYLDFF